VEHRTLSLAPLELHEDALGFFRWGHVAGGVVVTNDAGDWARLSDAELADLLAGRVVEGHARFDELRSKGMLRDGLDLDALAGRLAQRSRHLRRGPHLHVVTLTGRDTAMTPDTAAALAEFVLQTTSPSVTVELQGHDGEPLRNLEALRRFFETAQHRNQRSTGKTLRWRLLTNCSALTEEVADWLIDNEITVVTTLDGPAALHDANRRSIPGASHAAVVGWIAYLQRRAGELGRDAHVPVEALLTTTRDTLGAAREVVEEYAARGLRSLRVRPLDRVRFDPPTWGAIGYTLAEYLEFYRHVLDAVLDVNRRGVPLVERMAAAVLGKMLTADDPGIVDLQSPNGAGTAQLAYDAQGRIFPSDEARIVDALGDPFFELGSVGGLAMQDVARHPTVRAIAAASLLDAQPMCADCWNKPFCGFSPVRNFLTQGDLVGQRPHCVECKEHMAVSTRLMELLADDGATKILTRWTAAHSPVAQGRLGADAP
jgi:His-Xaa-Ser system radical SAM maturase HxsB